MGYPKISLGIAAFSLATAMAAPVAAQTIIAPTSGVIDSGGPGFGSLTDTFNQAGLSANYTAGVTNFDAYLAGNPTHSLVFSGNEWFSDSGTNAATVTYNFGSAVGIDRLALWNEDASGIGVLGLSTSLDGVTFTNLGSFNPFNTTFNVDYPAEVFSFAATSAQYVRFTMTECPQSGGNFVGCAIGEVAFRSAAVDNAIPEPSTWALLILGFGAVGGAMRGRRLRLAQA